MVTSARLTTTRVTGFLLGLSLILGALLAGGSSARAVESTPAAGAFYAPIVGSGSTWSANALQAWIRNVWVNYQWKITYTESGSTQGRNDFRTGVADFGVSEIPYAISNSNEGDLRPQRGFAYMPIVAGGTAFMYNIQIAGRQVTNLRLSGENLALIFTGVITSWNDKRIAADNPGLAASLPAIPIVPVVRSDGSGTSAQFTLWMRQQLPSVWNAYCDRVGRPRVADGNCGVTSNYPVVSGSGFVSRAGANGVASYVAQAQAVGSITFVEYSYALNLGFPVVKMLNAGGYYTEPTAANVAVALLSAQINENRDSVDYLTQDLRNVYGSSDPRVYPLSSYSYIILPTDVGFNFTAEKGRTLADFGAYFLCEGQQSAEDLGYSPLPINLVAAGQTQIQRVQGGDPVIKGIAQCNNPTFSTDGTNRLANEAPMPEQCDRQGSEQCTRGTGGAAGTPTAGSGGGATGGAGAEGTDNGTVGSGSGGVTDTDTPLLLAGRPQLVPVRDTSFVSGVAIVLGVLTLLGVAIVPPLITRRRRRSAVAQKSGESPWPR
ncbi:MAG: phosphate ABC transporter substrate-binding protein [Leifsonia xyli]|nr:MAG: phosphate ABC transporter substrate-binding protein [Leifsonia xyli]